MNAELEYFISKLSEDFPLARKQYIGDFANHMIKRRFKKVGDEFIYRDSVASNLSKEDFYKIMSKGFQSKGSDIKKLFESYEYVAFITSEHTEIVDPSEIEFLGSYVAENKKLENKRPKDYIVLKSVLCTSLPYYNKNYDAFEEADLIDAIDAGQLSNLQPGMVDWNHDFQARGNTVHAEIVSGKSMVPGFDEPQDVKQIIVYSVFYSWRFPEEANKVREWADKGILTFSMACGAESVEYKKIDSNDDYFSIRILKRPRFFANSIITPEKTQADENAVNLEIANKNEGEDMKELELKIAELEQQLEVANKNLSDALAKLEDPSYTQTISENESLKSQIAELQSKIADSDAVIAELKEKVLALDAENLILNNSVSAYESERISELSTRVEEINEARKIELVELIGDGADQWLEEYKAELIDNIFVDHKEKYDKFVALLKAKTPAGTVNQDSEDSSLISISDGVMATKSGKTSESTSRLRVKSWAGDKNK